MSKLLLRLNCVFVVSNLSLPTHPMLKRDVFDRMLSDCCPGVTAVTASVLNDEMDIIVSLVVSKDIFWGQLQMV